MGPAFSGTDSTDHLPFFLILHLGININPGDLPKTLTETITAMRRRRTSRATRASEPVPEKEGGGEPRTEAHIPFKLVDDEHGQAHEHHREQHQHGGSTVRRGEVDQWGWGKQGRA